MPLQTLKCVPPWNGFCFRSKQQNKSAPACHARIWLIFLKLIHLKVVARKLLGYRVLDTHIQSCRPRSTWHRALALILCVGVLPAIAAAQSKDSLAADSTELPEVTVNAERVRDHEALKHAVRSFVQSRSTPGTRTNQIGRWYEKVCPLVTGLQSGSNKLVAREVLDLARDVGAPVAPDAKTCNINIEIIFTSDPQDLLDDIARLNRTELGYFPTSQRNQMTTFTRPIQAWYQTGTRQTNCQPPRGGEIAEPCDPSVTQLDADVGDVNLQPSGFADRLKKGLRSEFGHVLIIVDSRNVARYSLSSIADYAAMLSLSRMTQLENCASLASITDLLASGCANPAPDTLTAADRAYLKALYATDLEAPLSLERGDLGGRMIQQIEGH